MWALVYVVFVSGKLDASTIGLYATPDECIYNRSVLSLMLGGDGKFFPPNYEAGCVFVLGEKV